MRERRCMAESDEKLMQRTGRGDLTAFGELFDRHLPAEDRETAAVNESALGFGDGFVQAWALREEVRRALGELPPVQRACLILREYEQRSYQEIGAILECSPENARVLAFRARRAL